MSKIADQAERHQRVLREEPGQVPAARGRPRRAHPGHRACRGRRHGEGRAQGAREEALKAAKSGKDFARARAAVLAGRQRAARRRPRVLPAGPDGAGVRARSPSRCKPGEISDLVETQFGYHIIKVIEKRQGGTVPFAQAAPQIQQFLESQAQSDKGKAYVEALRARGKVEILI